MAYILNVDFWDWVHPETNKVLRLRKGDEVPAEVLKFVEGDKEAFFAGPRPVLLNATKGEGEVRETPPKSDSQEATSSSPKQSVDKK